MSASSSPQSAPKSMAASEVIRELSPRYCPASWAARTIFGLHEAHGARPEPYRSEQWIGAQGPRRRPGLCRNAGVSGCGRRRLGALEALGPDYRIETNVLGQGALAGTTWRGSLVLQGHGDPTLSHADLNTLARQVRAAGIRKVAGPVLGDESYFDSRRTAPGWKPSFYIHESAPLSALTVDRTWFHTHHSGAPAAAAAALFKDALRAQGVFVTGPALRGTANPEAQPLAAVLSPPLAQVVRFMDRESDNFTAELLLKQLGAMDGAVGTSARGAAQVRTTLNEAGIPLAGVRIVDGSGLSQLDRLTARAIVGILQAAWNEPELKPSFVDALAVAGRSGTLKDRLRGAPARGVVLAKTGTTAIASALSGFVRKRYAFSVLQNGHPVSSWWARRAQDRFATVLASQ